MTASLVRELYGVEADVLQAPVDESPVVVARACTAVTEEAIAG